MNIGPFLIMIAASLWAVDALFRTALTQTLSPASIVFLEHLIGFLLLSPLWFRERHALRTLRVNDWLVGIVLTLISGIGGTLLFTESLGKSFATGDFITPLLLQKTQPIIVIGLSALFLKEKLSKTFMLFTPIAILGSYLISFGATAPQLQWYGKERIVLLALGASFSWGAGTLLSKRLLSRLTFAQATYFRFFLAIPLGYIVARMIGVTPSLTQLSSEELLRFITIGLSTGAAAILLYYRGLATTTASVSTIAELVFPAVSLAIAVTPINPYGAPQTLMIPHIIGIILLIGSVLVISVSHARRKDTFPLSVEGVVVRGTGDGKKLGFPTANMSLSRFPDITHGVYACTATVAEKSYEGILHFGPRRVFGETHPQFEVHLFSFNRTIYWQSLQVTIMSFVRPTMNFSSLDALVKQMKIDVKDAKKALKSIPSTS